MNNLYYADHAIRWFITLFATFGILSFSLAEPETIELKLPEPITSFGACVSGDDLYVYGGHRGDAHVYSRETHSRHFVRVDLAKMDKWEELPFGKPLQGFGMAAYGGKIYLAGGSQATNEPGTGSNLTSTADVSVFDPASKAWRRLPPLPAPRSSHELLAKDGKLYVVGGWSMANGKGVEWFDHSLLADLSVEPLKWEKIHHPDWRARAHSAAILARSSTSRRRRRSRHDHRRILPFFLLLLFFLFFFFFFFVFAFVLFFYLLRAGTDTGTRVAERCELRLE